MRSPPPIPRLRPTLELLESDGGFTVRDRRTGRIDRLDAGPWQAFFTLLRGRNRPSHAELVGALGISRLDAQGMVAKAVALHLFATARAAEQVRIRATGRHLRGSARLLYLDGGQLLSSRSWRELRRTMQSASRGLGPPLERVRAWIATVSSLLDARHGFFGDEELFASRDAFHIVRPDLQDAPDRFRSGLQRFGALHRGVEPSLGGALEAVLSGQLPEGPRVSFEAVPHVFSQTLRRAPERPAEGGLLGALARGHLFECLVAASGADSAGARRDLARKWSRPEVRVWLTAHRTLVEELFFVQAEVFHGVAAPRSIPPWWPWWP